MGASDRIFTQHIPNKDVGASENWKPSPLGSQQTTLSKDMEAKIVAREQAAFERGREVGFAEAAQIAQQTRARHAEQVDAVLQALVDRFAELEGAAADRVLDLALAIAAQVVRREVRRPESLLAAAREAVATLIDQHAHPRIHVHPNDFEVLRASLGADGVMSGCRFVPDAGVGPYGCRVEVSTGEIDVTVATRWRRVLEALGVFDLPLAAYEAATARATSPSQPDAPTDEPAAVDAQQV